MEIKKNAGFKCLGIHKLMEVFDQKWPFGRSHFSNIFVVQKLANVNNLQNIYWRFIFDSGDSGIYRTMQNEPCLSFSN